MRSRSQDRLHSRSPSPEIHRQHEYLGLQDQSAPISVLLTKGRHNEGGYNGRRGVNFQDSMGFGGEKRRAELLSTFAG